jgi:hypothetical protein
MKTNSLRNLLLKIYDKLLVAILFSGIFISSCEEPEPVPEYGIVPLYGVPTAIDHKHKINTSEQDTVVINNDQVQLNYKQSNEL